MGYIRSNQDWYEQRAKDLRAEAAAKHVPDSIREKLLAEAAQNDKDAQTPA